MKKFFSKIILRNFKKYLKIEFLQKRVLLKTTHHNSIKEK